MTLDSNRRIFLRQAAAAGAAAVSSWYVNPRPAAASTSALEKINVAAIGTANRAAKNISACAGENIVALADIDAKFLAAAGEQYRCARRYRDFRVLLEKESPCIDAVIVSTPDHTHAPAAAMAMRLGKHVYCEKPLTHTVYEARQLAHLAAENNVVTQMGSQIHAGENYRRVVELIESGAIGPVDEVHVWVDVDYSGGRLHKRPQPAHVDWDLWLGPAPARDYVECTIGREHQTVHPIHWRWFWEYGTGGLGDFGCHFIDLAHWSLQLKHPTSVAASGPEPDEQATTSGLTVSYEYPARGELPPVRLTWYDGGQKPPLLSKWQDDRGQPLDWPSGLLFVGERGAIYANYGEHRLLPWDEHDELPRPAPYLPPSIGHHNEWLAAIKSGGAVTCNFDYAGALTEAVLLGVVAYRSGDILDWDAANLLVRNSAPAQQLIHKEYRQGWTL